jgi:hypothetical protein
VPDERNQTEQIDPQVRDAVVAFLRDWLPAEARRTYRAMIREDPLGWSKSPHFGQGVIVEHALRGNGLDEKTLGVSDLERIWPELLRRAVEEEKTW